MSERKRRNGGASAPDGKEGKDGKFKARKNVVRIVSVENRRVVKARLDDGYPQFFGGYGGWEDEARPGQVSATVFRGTNAPQLKLRLILGGWPEQWPGTDCERDMKRLDGFARLAFDDRQDRPTLVRVRGQVPHHHRRWFIEKLEWGDVDVFVDRRVRAFVTVTLRMYVPVELLRRRDPVVRRTRFYTPRRGETLQRIVRDRMDLDASGEITLARWYVRRLSRLGPSAPIEGRRLTLPVGTWWRKAAKDARRRIPTNGNGNGGAKAPEFSEPGGRDR